MKPKSAAQGLGSMLSPETAGQNTLHLATGQDRVEFRFQYTQGSEAGEMVFVVTVDGGHRGDRCIVDAEQPGPKPPLHMEGTITTDRKWDMARKTSIPADYHSEVAVTYLALDGRRVPADLRITLEVCQVVTTDSGQTQEAQPLSAFGVVDAGEDLAVRVGQFVFTTSSLDHA